MRLGFLFLNIGKNCKNNKLYNMKYLKGYDTNSERSTDIINLHLPYVTYTRDTGKIYADGGYISDGLVFQLDGIQRGPESETKWIDLINGQEFIKPSGTISWGDKYFIMGEGLQCVNYFGPQYNQMTFEIVFSANGSGNSHLFQCKGRNATNGLGIGRYNSNWLLSNATGCSFSVPLSSMPLGDTVYRLSYSYRAKPLLNGVQINYGTVDYYYGNQNGYAYLGGSSSLTGKIYTIRMYNRILSYDEMEHNQQVDKKRFLS